MESESLLDVIRRWWNSPACDMGERDGDPSDLEWDPDLCRCGGDAYSGLIACDYCMESPR